MMQYKWNAEDYANHSGQQQLWAQELINRLSLRGTEWVLDIGCGDGKVTAQIAQNLPEGRVLGIDKSPEMVNLASRQYPLERYTNLEFQQGDAEKLGFENAFDVVFSNATLHWVIDHRPVLSGIFRCLKPGGRFLMQMGGKGNAAGLIACLDELIARPAWSDYFKGFQFPYGFYAPEEYLTWMQAAGLTPQKAVLIPKKMEHAGRDGFAGWFRTTWMPYFQWVPESQRSVFIDMVVDIYLESHPIDPEGRVIVDMVRLEVEGYR